MSRSDANAPLPPGEGSATGRADGGGGVRVFCDIQKKHASHAITGDLSIADIAEGKVPKLRKLRPSVSRGVEAMMKKALARKPKDRFGNAEEMVLALEPHWSPQIANPKVLAGLMAALFKDRAREFKERRTRGRTLSEVSRPIGPL